MPNHTVSALVKKLSVLRGRQRQLDRDITDLAQARTETTQQIQTLEDAIRILEPGFDLGTVASTKEYFILFRRGELGKLCLKALRGQEAPEVAPISTGHLATS